MHYNFSTCICILSVLFTTNFNHILAYAAQSSTVNSVYYSKDFEIYYISNFGYKNKYEWVVDGPYPDEQEDSESDIAESIKDDHNFDDQKSIKHIKNIEIVFDKHTEQNNSHESEGIIEFLSLAGADDKFEYIKVNDTTERIHNEHLTTKPNIHSNKRQLEKETKNPFEIISKIAKKILRKSFVLVTKNREILANFNILKAFRSQNQ